MTNKKLKKRIRQAFENATPDLAASVAVDSLFSDPLPQKSKERSEKPMRTPMQFRPLPTLVASIVVVALLIGLLPQINPFVSSDDPDGALNQSQTATGPTDKVQIDPDFSYDTETDDFDWSPYYQYFNPTHSGKQTLFHQTVQVDGKTYYRLAADYQLSGEYLIVDAQTNEVLERKELIGSTLADEPLAYKYGYMAISYVITDWWFALVDDVLCYEYNIEFYKGTVVARINAITGEILYDELTPPVNTDPLNTEGPPVQGTEPDHADFEPLYVALEHAGLTKDDIYDYKIEADTDDVVPHWDVTLYTTDYEYDYVIEYRFGEVLRVEKEYTGSLTGLDTSVSINANEAVKIATGDRLVGTNASVSSTPLKTKDGISFYKIYFSNAIYWVRVDVSSSLGIILDVEIANRNYYFSVDEDLYISTIYPSGGKYPGNNDDAGFDSDPDRITENQALYFALNHAGFTREDVYEYTTGWSTADEIPHWDITFKTADYKYEYEYEIQSYTGEILKIEREYTGELDYRPNYIISSDSVIQIAKNDHLVKDSPEVNNDYQKHIITKPDFEVYLTSDMYNYKFTISTAYAIVLELEITNRNYYPDFGDSEVVPPDGKVGSDNAINTALQHLGLSRDAVSDLVCEEDMDDGGNNAHYDVTFRFQDDEYRFEISMYNPGEILTIRRLPVE